MPDPVHLAHYLDGYPLCWPMDRDGDFTATSSEPEVTCAACKRHLDEAAA